MQPLPESLVQSQRPQVLSRSTYPFALLPNTFNSIAANMANAVAALAVGPALQNTNERIYWNGCLWAGGNAYKEKLARPEGLDSPTAPRAQINLSKNDPVKSSA